MNLDDLEHLSLDTLITKNRDRASLGRATEAETTALLTVLNGEPIAVINDWRLIAYRLVGHESVILLLGENDIAGTTWITSQVASIDLEHRLVQTVNSLYSLGVAGEGEPPLEQLFLLVTQLRRNGLATTLGLPEVSG
jgi:hypothetical protein